MLDFYGPELPPLDPAHVSRLMAVQAIIWPSEAEELRKHLASVGPGTVRKILAELSARSAPDAAMFVRREIFPTIPGSELNRVRQYP